MGQAHRVGESGDLRAARIVWLREHLPRPLHSSCVREGGTAGEAPLNGGDCEQAGEAVHHGSDGLRDRGRQLPKGSRRASASRVRGALVVPALTAVHEVEPPGSKQIQPFAEKTLSHIDGLGLSFLRAIPPEGDEAGYIEPGTSDGFCGAFVRKLPDRFRPTPVIQRYRPKVRTGAWRPFGTAATLYAPPRPSCT